MRWRFIFMAGAAIAAAGVAVLVYAQLSDTQTATGSVNVSTTSADLYICEPNSTPGPACGSDDSGADESIFQTLEDLLPGETVQWDLRLKNVGTENWAIENVGLTIVETADPGTDCPNFVLEQGRGTQGQFSPAGVFVLGKNGDSLNDNLSFVSGLPNFAREDFSYVTVTVAPGDYEDVRLRLRLNTSGVGNCDANVWNVSWQFSVLPFIPPPTPTPFPTVTPVPPPPPTETPKPPTATVGPPSTG